MAATLAALASHATRLSEELFDDLLLWLEEGKTLSTFCVERKLARRTVYGWMKRDPNLAAWVAQARRIGEAAIEDEILAIADTPSDHPDDVQHRKLMIYAREKRLVWSNPDRYSQRKQIDQRIEQRVVLTDIEREVRIKELLDKATVKPQIAVEVHEDEPSDAER